MSKVRVLVVDDAALVRKILSEVLAAEPGIEVAGTAANGRLALDKIPFARPDVITLDVEMPEMDGLETLKALREKHPQIPVIMVSGRTEQGAAVTLEALQLGASDYVAKPSGSAAREELARELPQKVLALCRKPDSARIVPVSMSKPGSRGLVTEKPEILAIGVSTGGPVALNELMPRLPADLDVPIVITQHMPPVFTRILAEQLASRSKFPVVEAAQGMKLEKNTAYLAPGDYHLEISRDAGELVINLSQGPKENHCRPAVDVMLRSVVAEFGGDVLAVILTGLGCDGARGCDLVRSAGGLVFAQDRESSVVWGMPGSVVNAGLADSVLPLSAMHTAIESVFKVDKSKSGRLRSAQPCQ